MVELPSREERGVDRTTPALYSGTPKSSAQTPRELNQLADVADTPGLDFPSGAVALAELKQKIGNYAEAEELFRSALEKVDAEGSRDSAADVPPLKGLIANHILSGAVDGAEPLVDRLATVAGNIGDDPEIVLALNDLVRLSLSHSAYGIAEPLLLCLLDIKRSKGEDRPEVATVLASLAVVRQALGQHEAAEQLWREVIEIRERTLAPNHFAITSALEHLASACAARGNVSEALHLFQRAHTMRALTLGVDHQSLRFSRERIADLQLQADEIADLDRPVVVPRPRETRRATTRKQRTVPPWAASREPAVAADSTAVVLPIEREVRPPAASEIATTATAAQAVAIDAPLPAKPIVAYRDLISHMPRPEEISERIESLGIRIASILETAGAYLRTRYKAVLGIIGVVALLVIAQAASSRASGRREATSQARPARGAPRVVPKTPAAAATKLAAASRPAEPSKNSAVPTVSEGAASTTKEAAESPPRESEKARSRDSERSSAKESKKKETAVALPTTCRRRNRRDCVPRDLGVSVGAIAEAASARTTGAVVAPPVVEAAFPSARSQQSIGYGDAGPEPVGARLIGSLPTPRYPKELTDLDGDVRVRFNIDTNGRPIMSSFAVVASSHPLFTAAVRDAVQRMRFEPALSGGADPKPIVDKVEIPFRFKRNGK